MHMFIYRRLLGIITKKDVLRHIIQLQNQDPDSILFNWAEHLHTQMAYQQRAIFLLSFLLWTNNWTCQVSVA